MLRRTKTTMINGKPILELPDRIVKIVECEFDRVQRQFYDSVQEKVQTSLEKLRQGDINKAYTSVLVLLLRLRQGSWHHPLPRCGNADRIRAACNHPCLISKDYKTDAEAVDPKSASQNNDEEDDADDLAGLMAGLGITRKPCQLCQKPLTSANSYKETVCMDCSNVYEAARKAASDPSSDLPPHSAKTRMIVKLLTEIDGRGEGEKTIIFSQFTSMLDLIEPFLKHEGVKFVRCSYLIICSELLC